MTIRAALARLLLAAAALAAAPAFAQNFLWRVDSITNHVWLFGTIHAGKPQWYPLPRAINDAFEDSTALVVEADITDKTRMEQSAPAMTYEKPDSLRKHVPPADYERFLRVLPRYAISEAQVAQMKPFIAASLLVFAEWTRLGYLPQLGVDEYLLEGAKLAHKPILELEGVAEQAKLMDSLTDAQARTIFEGTLDGIEKGYAARQIEDTVRAWQVGDEQLMLDAVRRYDENVKGATDYEEKFVWSRHGPMLDKISNWLDHSNGPRFVAVGALHLLGPRGLVEQLRARGYTVKRIFVAPEPEGGKKHE